MTGHPALERVDDLPAEEAERLFLTVCTSPVWARRLAQGRPYRSVDALLAAADEALAGLSEHEVDAALAGHPRIGERTREGSPSRREQAGLAGISSSLGEALAEGNRAYEERFGHVYLVCATGRSAPELLAVLQERLGHDPAQERRVLRDELGKINRLRLKRLLAAPEAP